MSNQEKNQPKQNNPSSTYHNLTAFQQLIDTIRQLRSPNGCPWDKEQTHKTLKPYLVEETYEVLDAIDNGNSEVLQDELGDLLLQIVLHAQIASEQGQFDLADVAQGIANKMIRRHPHVFSDIEVGSVKEVWQNWEKIKKGEKSQAGNKSILDSIPPSLPALFRANKIQKKAARVGFDWPDNAGALAKVAEEVNELQAAIQKKEEHRKVVEEFGDLLFSMVNVSRKLDIDAEDALRLATKKFEQRFKYIEAKCAQNNKELSDYNLTELDNWWNEAKTNGL